MALGAHLELAAARCHCLPRICVLWLTTGAHYVVPNR